MSREKFGGSRRRFWRRLLARRFPPPPAFQPERVPPENGSIRIADGAPAVNTPAVTLTLASADAGLGLAFMRISEDPAFTGASWEPFATSRAWTLSDGDGPKIVYARFADRAGNASLQAVSATVVLDTSVPPAPVALATSPASPAPATQFSITGTAEPGAAIRVYAGPDCFGTLVGAGIAGSDGAFSIPVTVPVDSTATFTITATDAAGNVSACAGGPVYVNDATPPAAPVLAGTSPASPSAAVALTVMGSAEPGAVVRLFASEDCSGPAVASGVAGTDGRLFVAVTVTEAATTRFTATATDAAGNVSGCSNRLAYENVPESVFGKARLGLSILE